jgi:hypothetical protein
MGLGVKLSNFWSVRGNSCRCELWGKVLGVDHPDTLTSMGNLASTLWRQRQWKEAEDMEMRVMETRQRVLGYEYPDTLMAMGNLAFS